MEPYNAGDEAHVKKASAHEEFDQGGEIEDMLAVMATPEGRRVMWRILSYCRPLAMSYVPGGLTEDMFFNEGKKDVGNFIITALTEADPFSFADLMRENIEDV